MLFLALITLLFMIALSITVIVVFIILVVSDSENKSQRTGVPKRRISRAEYIGKRGEREVNNILHRLDRSNYKIYHDLYIPTENNSTAQIDHIVTSPFGIFVVETKHFSGWIFGSERNKKWTQVIYKNRESFLNPIWQNAGHIKALENYLNVDKKYLHSIVAFSDKATFKFKDEFKRAYVIYYSQLRPVIKQHTEMLINEESLQKINRLLDDLVIIDPEKKREIEQEHIERIRARDNDLNESESQQRVFQTGEQDQSNMTMQNERREANLSDFQQQLEVQMQVQANSRTPNEANLQVQTQNEFHTQRTQLNMETQSNQQQEKSFETELQSVRQTQHQKPLSSKTSYSSHQRNNNKVVYLNTAYNEKCPKCNSDVVRKENKYGVFWGCINFPTCGYKRIVN